MIKPKHSFGKPSNVFQINKDFVNRESAKRLFLGSVNAVEDEYNILMYYGVGGIGKSTLKNELINIHDLTYRENAIRFHLDFNVPENRNPGDALLSLVDSLESKKKYSFDCFELAYSLYFKRKFPGTAYSREKEDLANKFNIGLSIVSIFDSGVTQTTVSIVEKFVKLLKSRKLDDEIKEDLKNFDSLSIKEIEERLPAYFEYDLRYIQSQNPNLNIIFVIDTFEALNVYENEAIHRNRNERWIKDFIAHFPRTLFLIFGREKLQWEDEWMEFVKLCELKNFERKYSYEFLKNSNVTNDEIIDAIVDSCEGYPFYLSLALKTYADIVNEGKTPKANDFGKNYSDIIERFVYNLNNNDVELLKILSIPRFYTKEIFVLLIQHFIPSYTMTKFHQFNEYSFVSNEREKYFIHVLMKNGLRKFIDHETRSSINGLLLDHYEVLFQEKNIKDDFEELIYHKCELSSIEEFNIWIYGPKLEYLGDLQRRGEQDYILKIILHIINKYSLENLSIELLNVYIDIVHLGGDYEAAVSVCEDYLKQFTIEDIVSNKNILRIGIRKIHHSMFFHPVDELIESAVSLDVVTRNYKDEYGELLFLIGGNLGVLSGDFDFAEMWLNKTLSYATEISCSDLKIRGIRKLVDVYSVTGRIGKGLDLIERFISLDSEPETRYHVYLLGALGEIYRKLKRFDEALYCFDRLKKISEKKNLKGWVAHSYLGKSMVHHDIGEYDLGLELVRKAKNIYDSINQKWGQINAETVRCMLCLSSMEDDDTICTTLNKIKSEAHLMNYSYNEKIVEEIISNKEYRDIYLLFL